MSRHLDRLTSPMQLHTYSDEQLRELAGEIRDELVRVLSIRSAHFASNLGVVELTLALHSVYDFAKDRIIWDTGHQIYPHKLITGRQKEFNSIRTLGGLMGFPNPNESPYDLFMTGHAGCSVSTASGLRAGDELLGQDERQSVAVIGDGALVSGVVFEAFNNISGMNQNLLVILNDNTMSICPRTGGLAKYLDQCCMTGLYQGSKRTLNQILSHIPIVGDLAGSALLQLRDGLKAAFKEGMLFEELGFRYFGPIDGHDVGGMRKILKDLRTQKGPILLHVFTEKGHGVPQAAADPVVFHSPPVFEKVGDGYEILSMKRSTTRGYTDAMSSAIESALARDKKVAVLTAAMCQGNKLEKVRERFPDRFFDVGICESHAVAFAAGMSKAGAKPIIDIYSTFLQRAFDQVFQEACLQNLPMVFAMDRAGLAGPDGPTHHGVFDVPYMRLFPNMTLCSPGDESEVGPMLDYALDHPGPIGIRYPKANLEQVERPVAPIELGKAEVVRDGCDGAIVVYGPMMPTCLKAAVELAADGLDIAVINARWVKPIDAEMMTRLLEVQPFIVTVEEGTVVGGFGSALLELANEQGLDARKVVRLGIPDRFVQHGERHELLAEVGIDLEGIKRAVRREAESRSESSAASGC